jgi:outer membrane immunogenic protein
MTRLVLGALAALEAGLSTPARSADFNYNSRARYTVNQPLNAYSWAGPYLGGNFGYAWGSVDNALGQAERLRRRPAGRLQLQRAPGYSASRATSRARAPTACSQRGNFPTPGSARCAARRLCLQQHPVLRHAGTGVRRAARRYAGLSGSTNVGWTAGVGAEFGFAPNWSAKIEYLYVDLANSNFVITGASHGLSFGTVRAGVNYRFSAQ